MEVGTTVTDTPRTDWMAKTIKGMSETARARNLAFLCRNLERELRRVGSALAHQDERWGLYGSDSKASLREFKSNNPGGWNP